MSAASNGVMRMAFCLDGSYERQKLAGQFGAAFELSRVCTLAVPTPSQLAAVNTLPGLPRADSPAARGRGGGGRGRLDAGRLRALPPDERQTQLQQLPGIGPFYRSLIVNRAGGHADVPAPGEGHARGGDPAGVRRRHELTNAELDAISEDWKPFRTWVTVMMRARAGRYVRENDSMPEGDTVWRACQRLNEVLAGRELTRSEFRVPTLATTDLTGIAVREVVSRGKHQLFRFANDLTLHTHFRMEGAWRIYAPGRRWTGGPDFQIRAVLATADHHAVGYRLPVTELVPTADEASVVGHLGPDLLGPDWDLDEALRRITRQPGRTIGEALLDQRNLAGIGTFYRAELLFLQGLHPRTPVAAVPNLRRVVQRGQQLLHANRWRPEQSTTGDLRPHRRAYVFERPGQPCRRCGTPIRTEEFGTPGQERRSYWCPRCQPSADSVA